MRFRRVDGGFGDLAAAPFLVRPFLARPLVARLATAGPVVRPVWFLWEDETFWVLTGMWSRLEQRLSADPRFELVIDVCDLVTGEVRQVIGSGTGSVVPFDVPRGQRKLIRYLGSQEERWPPRFSLHGDPSARGIRWARLAPDSLLITDQSFDVADRPADADPRPGG